MNAVETCRDAPVMSAVLLAILGRYHVDRSPARTSGARGARVKAIELLDRVRAERVRLDTPDDEEAVHDFRVALRRLRSWLKALAPHLGNKGDRLRRKLGDLADLTAEA